MADWAEELLRIVRLLVPVLILKIFLRIGAEWTSKKLMHATNSSTG